MSMSDLGKRPRSVSRVGHADLHKRDEPETWDLTIAPCFGCGRIFAFNSERVPSVVIDGAGKPLCYRCVKRANPIREAKGLERIPVLPGAYEGSPPTEVESPRRLRDRVRARFGSEVYVRPEWPAEWSDF